MFNVSSHGRKAAGVTASPGATALQMGDTFLRTALAPDVNRAGNGSGKISQ